MRKVIAVTITAFCGTCQTTLYVLETPATCPVCSTPLVEVDEEDAEATVTP